MCTKRKLAVNADLVQTPLRNRQSVRLIAAKPTGVATPAEPRTDVDTLD